MTQNIIFKKMQRNSWVPLLFISAFFISITLTTVKSAILFLAILLLNQRKTLQFIDLNLLLTTAFIFIYFLASSDISKTETSSSLLFTPTILYIAGRWLGSKLKTDIEIYFSFLIIGFLLSLIPILSVLINIIDYGFEDGGRSISLTQDDFLVSATVLTGMMIIPLSYIGTIFNRYLSIYYKTIVLLIFIISIFVSFRLGSRTAIIIALISVFFGIMNNNKKIDVIKTVIILLAVSTLFSATISYNFENIDLFKFYQDRLDSEDSGVSSFGGRTERWVNSLILLANNPLGWDFYINGYSHNFWLDVARNGGWISFTLSILLILSFLWSLKIALSKNKHSQLYTTTIVCVGASFIAIFMVEPILDGFTYTFFLFMLFWGLIKSIKIT